MTDGDIFMHGLLWTFLIAITVGLAAPFYAYALSRKILNNVELIPVDSSGRRLE